MTSATTITVGHDIETKGKMAYCSCGWRGLAKWASELRIHVPAVMMDTTSSIITTKEYRGFQLNVLYGGGDVQVIIATAEAAAAYEAAKGIAKEIGSEVARMGESLPTIEKMITEVIYGGVEAPADTARETEAPAVTVESAEVEAPAPSQPQAQDDGSITGGPKATAKQISYIRSLIARHGTDDLSVGLPADLSTISRRHASQAISILRGEDA